MIVDGETYACEGCIRGHRTRNCQHADRPLQHIKAKGRPVSQCNHCRAERKNRSAHVKCQCGKRASEGGSDCGCFSGGKCKCATKKSPKMEPKQLDAVSELSSPGSTLNTASPAQFSVASDMPWSGNTTPGSNFASLGALPEFDPSSWGQATTQLDLPGGFDAGVLHGNMTTIPEATNGLVLPDFDDQQIQATMPDFSQMADWPNMDEGESKQLLAMMNNPANMEMGAFDPNTINMLGMGSADPGFGLDFASLPQQPTSQEASTQTTTTSKCGSKPEKECGPCCG